MYRNTFAIQALISKCYSNREHPEIEIQKSGYEEYYESESQRELRQIFNGQSQMFDALRELHRKLDEIVGRQERALSLISQIGQGGKLLITVEFISKHYVSINSFNLNT